jgi:hypothetical protein
MSISFLETEAAASLLSSCTLNTRRRSRSLSSSFHLGKSHQGVKSSIELEERTATCHLYTRTILTTHPLPNGARGHKTMSAST